MLKIYNSLTKTKEEFRPIEPGRVSIYVCGMTVYDYCHLGHARVLVVFDTVVRYLRATGFKVKYVRNITDIDDKIIRRANERGKPIQQLTTQYIKAMHEDAKVLGVLPPDVEPRATESMAKIITMISSLIDKGYAYQGASGDVYYEVSKFRDYGKLSGKAVQALRAGARVEVNEAKRDPLDFVLWKTAKTGEPAWDSPWGPGRPGWHIECSAMSTAYLGAHFDIHGGGMDLQFPHHENEIAQSEASTGEHFVNYWMHNGFVRINEEKMSKSLGNFFTVREVIQRYRPEEVRYFILSSHYRSPLNYSDDQLDHARNALTRLYTALRGLPDVQPPRYSDHETRFHNTLEDDFNTAEALAVMFDLAHELNKHRQRNLSKAASQGALLRQLGRILGLLQENPEAYLKGTVRAVTLSDTVTPRDTVITLSEAEIERRIAARNEARAAKDWEYADRIRDELKSQGIVLEDGAYGTTWRRM
jgi:cysteinyl-tRNA synthetase